MQLKSDFDISPLCLLLQDRFFDALLMAIPDEASMTNAIQLLLIHWQSFVPGTSAGSKGYGGCSLLGLNPSISQQARRTASSIPVPVRVVQLEVLVSNQEVFNIINRSAQAGPCQFS